MHRTGKTGMAKLNNLVFILPVTVLVVFTFFIAQSYIPVILLSFISISGILAYFTVRFNLQVLLLKAIAFTLPFSVEIPFFMNSMMRFPGEPLIIIAAITLIIEIFRQPFKGFNNSLHREFLWVLPLLLAFIVSIPFSEMLFVSVKFSFINILYISVFLVFLSRHLAKNPGLFSRLLLIYGMGIIIVALWGFFRLWQWEFNPVVMRGIFQPFFKDHTIFGASSAILAAIFLVSGFKKSDSHNRLLLWLLTVAFISLVLFSKSRAAFLSLAFMLAFLLLMVMKIRLLHLAVAFAVLSITAWSFRGNIKERLSGIDTISYDEHAGFLERQESAANITTDISNIERLNRWVSALRMFKEKPLTGFGPGTYQFTYIPYQEPGLMNRLSVTNPFEPPEGSGGTAHSEYLLALSEMGILGLIGWIVLLGRWVFIAFEKSRNHPSRWLIIAAMAGLSTYFFHANFNNFLTTDKFAFLFWGTAAWLIANLYGTEKKPGILSAD